MDLLTRDKFWIKDPAILFKNGNYKKIIPTTNMTYIEKLNAVTRLLLYITIVIMLFTSNAWIILIPIIGIIAIIMVYYYTRKQIKNSLISEKFTNITTSDTDDNNENDNIEFGDSLENMCRQNSCCKLPTKENPMMNVTMADLMDNVDRPPACNYTSKIQADIDDIFDDNSFSDTSDPFNRKHSQRQFYTMPSTTIPNDQSGFAEFLYPQKETCKENQSHCLRYEDIRFSRHNPDIDAPEMSLD